MTPCDSYCGSPSCTNPVCEGRRLPRCLACYEGWGSEMWGTGQPCECQKKPAPVTHMTFRHWCEFCGDPIAKTSGGWSCPSCGAAWYQDETVRGNV